MGSLTNSDHNRYQNGHDISSGMSWYSNHSEGPSSTPDPQEVEYLEVYEQNLEKHKGKKYFH